MRKGSFTDLLNVGEKLRQSIPPLVLLFLISCSSVSNNPEPLSQNKRSNIDACSHTKTSFNCVKVVEVYDGDTIFIDLPDQHPLFGKRIGVRINGIDTPEMRTKNICEKKKAQKAKEILQGLLERATRVDVVDVQKDKYFRILGNVLVDGKPVINVLIQEKLAYAYHGDRKPQRNWCD